MSAPVERTVFVSGVPHDAPAEVLEALQALGEAVSAAVDAPVVVEATDDCEPGTCPVCGGDSGDAPPEGGGGR